MYRRVYTHLVIYRADSENVPRQGQHFLRRILGEELDLLLGAAALVQ